LAREGELPVPEVVRILRDVADALAYAHTRGVVHRDIKPDNVLISGHHAMVTDFGVAKAISEATGRTSLTSMGVALGTPAYMAPEQATADPHVDHRADLYALGALGYEMLTGRPPRTSRACGHAVRPRRGGGAGAGVRPTAAARSPRLGASRRDRAARGGAADHGVDGGDRAAASARADDGTGDRACRATPLVHVAPRAARRRGGVRYPGRGDRHLYGDAAARHRTRRDAGRERGACGAGSVGPRRVREPHLRHDAGPLGERGVPGGPGPVARRAATRSFRPRGCPPAHEPGSRDAPRCRHGARARPAG